MDQVKFLKAVLHKFDLVILEYLDPYHAPLYKNEIDLPLTI